MKESPGGRSGRKNWGPPPGGAPARPRGPPFLFHIVTGASSRLAGSRLLNDVGDVFDALDVRVHPHVRGDIREPFHVIQTFNGLPPHACGQRLRQGRGRKPGRRKK